MPLPRFQKLDSTRKRSILTAAAEEFGESGFEHASYNRIIERAGISKGAMYYYFADKDDLFQTVLMSALTEFLERIGFPFEADGPDAFWSACEQMYARSLEYMLEHPSNAALCLSITRARQSSGGHAVVQALSAQVMQWAEALVRIGQNLGAVRTDLPEDLMVQVVVSVMDAGDRWLEARWDQIKSEDVEETARMMVGLYRRIGEKEQSA